MELVADQGVSFFWSGKGEGTRRSQLKTYGPNRWVSCQTRRIAPSLNHPMPPVLIAKPARVAAAGTRPKLIDEYIGRVNSQTRALSVAHMRSPRGWIEPGQTPDFDEYTVSVRPSTGLPAPGE